LPPFPLSSFAAPSAVASWEAKSLMSVLIVRTPVR
jgi:hypothetical protein